jgi:hypothetical protein
MRLQHSFEEYAQSPECAVLIAESAQHCAAHAYSENEKRQFAIECNSMGGERQRDIRLHPMQAWQFGAISNSIVLSQMSVIRLWNGIMCTIL